MTRFDQSIRKLVGGHNPIRAFLSRQADRHRSRTRRRIAGGLGLLGIGLLVGFILIFRDKPRRLLDLIRGFNKRFLNPVMLRLAGRRYWYAAVVEHVGRRSGRTYVTPVVAEPTPDGFVVPLPYGTDVDWLRNVLAAGRCRIRWRGEEFACLNPMLIGEADLAEQVPRTVVSFWRLFGIKEGLKLTRMATDEAANPAAQSVAEVAPARSVEPRTTSESQTS